MSERRYTEEEAAEIFERAAQSQTQQSLPRQRAAHEGMTLAQLQEIGREVGIPSDLVAQAAGALTVAEGRPMERKLLGLPIGVGRTVELQRRITDAEWEQLVVDLRETFDARGRVREEGTFRSWNNGNLQALIEPTATSHRLRLRTFNANARTYMATGVALLFGGGLAIALKVLGEGVQIDTVTKLSILAAAGIGMFAFGALRLPAWARLRRQQMEEVAARLVASVSDSPKLPGSERR
jgi:hypothetical protein